MKKQIITYTLILSLPLLFFSCRGYSYRDARTFSQSDIKKTIYLTGEIIEIDEVLIPGNLFLFDSLLFTRNAGHSEFISVFHRRDMSKIGSFIEFGGGPGEFVEILRNIQFQDSLVWIFDGRASRTVNKYHISQFLQPGTIYPLEVIHLPDPFGGALITPNRIVTKGSLHHIHSRFSIYDLQGNFIENKGTLPDTGTRLTELELHESFSATMALHPDGEAIFVAYKATDLIEIYDANGNLKTRVHGPDQFFPIRQEVRDGNLARVRSISGRTRDAYFFPVAFSDEIWVVYDGGVFDPSVAYGFLSNRIIVFDWEGNPLRQYITDVGIYGLAVDRENRVIYALTIAPEHAFVRFRF